MCGPAAIIAVSLACPVIAAVLDEDHCPDVRIVVFRHHPGRLDTQERMSARAKDAEAILKLVKGLCRAHAYEGGLGSGYELSVHAHNLGRWKSGVDKLLRAGILKYYDRWGLDRQGYGLVPVR